MKMLKYKLLPLTALLLLAALTLFGCESPAAAPPAVDGAEADVEAVEADDEASAEVIAPGTGEVVEVEGAASLLGARAIGVSLSEIVGQAIQSVDGEELGTVDDVILNVETGGVVYVALSANDREGEFLPIPAEALLRSVDGSVDDEGLYLLGLDQEALAEAPFYSLDPEPPADAEIAAPYTDSTLYDPYYGPYYGYDTLYSDYWGGLGYTAGPLYDGTATGIYPAPLVRVSNLLGQPVGDGAGEEIATLEDLVFEALFVRYARLSLDGRSGLVPLYALIYNYETESIFTDLDQQILADVPSIDGEIDFTDAEWNSDFLAYWDEQALFAGEGMRALPSTNLQATELIGYGVVGVDIEDLGEIEDFVVDLSQNRIPYAVVSLGGFLDLGEELYPVPVSEFWLNRQLQQLVLPIDEEQLTDAPNFAEAEINEAIADAALVDELNTIWGTEVEAGEGPIVRANTLLGYDLVDADGEITGEIDDLIVDIFEGSVKYAVLEFGGFLDIGDREIVVPMQRLALDAENGQMIIDVDAEIVENAPEFVPLASRAAYGLQWEEEVDAYWAGVAD